MKSKHFVAFPFLFLLIFATACVPSPVDTLPTLAALSATPYASLAPITPSPMPSSTSTPAPPTVTATLVQQPTLDMCSRSQWRNGIFILSDLQFGSLEIGRAAKVSYNRTLIEKNPAWEGFTQYDEDLQHTWEEAGDIFLGKKFIQVGEGVAPGVLLITYGIEYNWEPPENGDLIVRVVYTRDLLWAYFISWWKGNVDKSLYPPIDNAATYALYRYFDGDMDKLEQWCSTFVEVFKEIPWD
jgi:hypothetical protein